MKKITLVVAFVLFSIAGAFAQIDRPVTWSYAAKKINAKEAVIYVKATIEKGWHIYSQNLKEGGPEKTKFTFTPSKEYSPVGKTSEPKAITKYEDSFKMNVSYFENQVVFQQKISLAQGNKPVAVKGKVEFMVCNDSKCLPPDEVSFSVPVK